MARPVRCGLLNMLLGLSLLQAGHVHAQDDEFSLDIVSVGGGGVTGESGEFSLMASVGSWEAGATSSDEFSTEGGFWSIAAVLQPPILTIVPAGPGQVTISWTPAADYVLQETSSLSPANWTNSPSGGTNAVNLAIVEDRKYYRLSKP